MKYKLLITTLLFSTSFFSFSTEKKKHALLIYEAAVNHIAEDKECLQGLLYLIGKNSNRKRLTRKFRVKERPLLKVSKYLYSNFFSKKGMPCLPEEHLEEKDIEQNAALSKLSTTDEEDKFLLYFSRISGNYLECKIVACRKSEESFLANTKIGKVMLIQFCFEEDRIVSSRVSTLKGW